MPRPTLPAIGSTGWGAVLSAAINAVSDAVDTIRSGLVVSVLDKGAVGDGVTEDTVAFQAAVDTVNALGGGIVRVPAGKTYVVDAVVLKSHVTIEMYGATLLSKSYAVFICKANGATGYGAGGRNIAIKGGRVKGSFLDGATHSASITMNKAQRVLIEDVHFVEACVSGHPIDPGGCDGLTIRRCVFEGWKPVTDREYTEAIGIDYSILLGNDVDAATPSSYDGAPTINVLVENCRFIALSYQVNGQDYPAPNAIGCHSRVQNQWIDNITFQNNYVEGGRDTSLYTASFSGLSRGWIHFFHGRGIRILNNTFKNVSGRACVVIGGQTIQTGILTSDTANAAPVAQAITPMPPTDWTIAGNRFLGFDAATTTEHLMYLVGHATGPTRGRKIRISNNSFTGCYPAGWDGVTANATGSQMLYGSYLEDIEINENDADTLRTFCEVRNTITLRVLVNSVQTLMNDYIKIFDTDTAHVIGNTCESHMGGIYLSNVTTYVIDGNKQVFNPLATTPSRVSHIAVTAGVKGVVSRNEGRGTYSPGGVANTPVINGIFLYGTSGDTVVESSNTMLNTATPVKTDTATGGRIFVTYRDTPHYSDVLRLLKTGQETVPRQFATGTTAAMTSGTVRAAYLTARRAETITSLRLHGGGTAAGATPTLVRAGLCKVETNGDLTMLATIANDTAIYATASTAYTRTLSTPVTLTLGQSYAVVQLVVTTATVPTVAAANIGVSGGEVGQDPVLAKSITGQTDLIAVGSAYAAANLAAAATLPYVVLVP